MTRDQTGIVGTTLGLLLASYLSCAGGAQAQGSGGPALDVESLQRTFQIRVGQYVALHRRLEGPRTRTMLTETTRMMFLSRATLASELRRTRAGANQGDIFSPEIAMVFRRHLETALRDGLMGDVLRALDEESEVTRLPVVNDDAPPDAALIALPACLLRVFPPLPEELEYGFLKRDLLLVDVHAGLIVDYVPAAIRSLTE